MKKVIAILMVLMMVSGVMFAADVPLVINASNAGVALFTLTPENVVVDLATDSIDGFRTTGVKVSEWSLRSTYASTSLLVYTDGGFASGDNPRVPYLLGIANGTNTANALWVDSTTEISVGTAREVKAILVANNGGVYNPSQNTGYIWVMQDGSNDEYASADNYQTTVTFVITAN